MREPGFKSDIIKFFESKGWKLYKETRLSIIFESKRVESKIEVRLIPFDSK